MIGPFSPQSEKYTLSSANASYTPATHGTFYDITSLSVSLTVSGNHPVFLSLIPDVASTGPHQVTLTDANSNNGYYLIRFYRDSTEISRQRFGASFGGRTAITTKNPVGDFFHIDAPSQGTYTYKAQIFVQTPGSDGSATITNVRLIAKELML